MVAPRLRIGPRSRYWVILPLLRAATSQPKKVVPYLDMLVLYCRWISLVCASYLQDGYHVCSDIVGAYHVGNDRS